MVLLIVDKQNNRIKEICTNPEMRVQQILDMCKQGREGTAKKGGKPKVPKYIFVDANQMVKINKVDDQPENDEQAHEKSQQAAVTELALDTSIQLKDSLICKATKSGKVVSTKRLKPNPHIFNVDTFKVPQAQESLSVSEMSKEFMPIIQQESAPMPELKKVQVIDDSAKPVEESKKTSG